MNIDLPTEPLIEIGTGPPIIILQGPIDNLTNWVKVIDAFSSTHKVIVPRLPLYSTPISGERLEALIAYLETFIEERELSKVILIGASFGGQIALRLAHKQPRKIKKMILVGSTGLVQHAFVETFLDVDELEFKKVEIENMACSIVSQNSINQIYHKLRNMLTIVSSNVNYNSVKREDISKLLDQIITPTLLIWGLQDLVSSPEMGLEFHLRLPQSKIIFLDDCGHYPMLDQPELLIKHIKEFVT